MKELPKIPGTKVLCPEECRYRNKLAPFCGYCLPVVMKKLGIEDKGKDSYDGKEQNEGNVIVNKEGNGN